MGRAINKSIMIAELAERRTTGLHQDTLIGSNDITDMWGATRRSLETTRDVSMIGIALLKNDLDRSSAGYRPPIALEQVKPLNDFEYEEGSPTIQGRGRGGQGRGRD